MTPKELENLAKTMEKAICNLAQDVKNTPSLEELVDALTYLAEEIQNMLDDAEAYFDEEQAGD